MDFQAYLASSSEEEEEQQQGTVVINVEHTKSEFWTRII